MEYIKKGFVGYFDFKGKATRKDFWIFYGFYVTTLMIGAFIDGLLGNSDVFYGSVLFVFFIPTLACGVRRMHDVGKSGWNLLLPFANLLMLLTASLPEGREKW